MSAGRRTQRDERRRRLGQNFLLPHSAEQFVREAGFCAGDFVVEVGAGGGAVTLALARAGAQVVAIEIDSSWADRLKRIVQQESLDRVEVVAADFLSFRLPARPFRVAGCLPFGQTTAILHHLLDDPKVPMLRADLIVQHEVARKRGASPPSTLLSTGWAPWWETTCGQRVPARDFRPVPKVDGAVLTITRRRPPLLPPSMAGPYADFVGQYWPFGSE